MEDIIRIPTRSLPWFKLIALTTGVGAGVGTAIATTLAILNNSTLIQEKEKLNKELNQSKKNQTYLNSLSKTLDTIVDELEAENNKLKEENTKFADIKKKYDNCKDWIHWNGKFNCIVPAE